MDCLSVDSVDLSAPCLRCCLSVLHLCRATSVLCVECRFLAHARDSLLLWVDAVLILKRVKTVKGEESSEQNSTLTPKASVEFCSFHFDKVTGSCSNCGQKLINHFNVTNNRHSFS